MALADHHGNAMNDEICTHCKHLLGPEAVTLTGDGYELTFCKLGCIADWYAARTEKLNRHLGLSHAEAHPAETRDGAHMFIAGWRAGRRDERIWHTGWLAGRRNNRQSGPYLARSHADV